MTTSKLGYVGNGTGKYSSRGLSESQIQTKIISTLQKNFPGIVVLKIHGGVYQKAGIPDLYVAYQGVSLWLEVKRPESDTTPLQHKLMSRLLSHGVFVATVDSPQDAVAALTEALYKISKR